MLKTMTVVLFAALIVGATSIALCPSVARSTEGQAPVTKVDFDQVSASVNTTPGIDYASTILTNVDFDQVFASIAERPHRDNTPANREKLRNAGWKRIL